MNWRKRNEEYPRFSDHDDQIGLLSRTLGEFKKFGDFCNLEFGVRPVPKWLELTKTDHLIQGKHWRDLDDLGVLLPCTADFAAFSSTKNASLSLQFSALRPARTKTSATSPVSRLPRLFYLSLMG
jgi:hypothetical protein